MALLKWLRTILLTAPAANNEENYSEAFLKCLSSLQKEIHGKDDPKEIALCILRAACEFYDADWCGVLDIDMSLKFWMPYWWYFKDTGTMSSTKIDDTGITGILPRWLNALENNEPIYERDIDNIKDQYPDEHAILCKLDASSFMAVPFSKKNKGFVMIRNQRRFTENTELLQMLSTILVTEMTEQKDINRKLHSIKENVIGENDITINLFGGLEIISAKGKLTEADIKSPYGMKVLVYLLMKKERSISAREIASKIWTDDDSDDPSAKVRTIIYRLRSSFRMIHDEDLIITTPNGYSINPNLNVRMDIHEFENIYEQLNGVNEIDIRETNLKKAFSLYRGIFFPQGSTDIWQMGYNSYYHLKYIEVAKELLAILHSSNNFSDLHHHAMKAFHIEPDNPHIIYWLITSLHKKGAVDLARQHLESAKVRLIADDYSMLHNMLRLA